jgi:nicotinate-nucleotide adenylyltransferase
MRLGVLGGTFDPIHIGHLDVARAACRAVPLDRIILLPAHVPPHRELPLASAPHRFAMAAIAALTEPWLEVSDLELQSSAPSFTTTTLDRFAAQGVDTRTLFFITGADAFREIRTWKDYPSLLDRCHFIVVSRPATPVASLRALLPDLQDRMVEAPCELQARPSIVLLDAPTAAVSSTAVRDRMAQGRPIGGLVPPGVEAHILKHRLYRQHSLVKDTLHEQG